MPADPITDVHAATARFPLPSPLHIGALEMTHREYAFVRVRTEGGREGKAFALSRDMPIAEIVRSVFAPRLIGADADVISARWIDMYRSTIPIGRVGVVMRALSLVDIALWAVLFVFCGEFSKLGTAYYHSAVNYTTLGYGDLIMTPSWRLLGPLEAADGMLMFGVSTAIVFTLTQRLVQARFVDLKE